MRYLVSSIIRYVAVWGVFALLLLLLLLLPLPQVQVARRARALGGVHADRGRLLAVFVVPVQSARKSSR